METTWRLAVRSSPKKLRYIVIAFRTDRTVNQVKNPSAFDHCGIKSMHVVLNVTRYPEMGVIANFDKMQYLQMYL